MRTSSEEERIVAQLGQRMRTKLRANSHKPHWRTEPGLLLLDLLLGEVWELEQELVKDADRANPHGADPEAILDECADVANFAAMIADNLAGAAARLKDDSTSPITPTDP